MWFPSPVGELHFSIVNEIHNDCKNFSKVSVPCRGTTFLNGLEENLMERRNNVSVPCRGTTFLNPWKNI